MKVKGQVDNKDLLDTIIEGILLKKGQEIANLDFADLENSVCSNFIICHGNSNIQVEAITQSVKKLVKEELNENPLHIEGLENALDINRLRGCVSTYFSKRIQRFL